jgi:hypothetical protein
MKRRRFSPLLFFTYEEEELLPLAVLYLWRGGASPPCCSSPMKSPCCSLPMKRRRFSPLLFFTYEEEELLPLAVLRL